jgi:hypothetical protein
MRRFELSDGRIIKIFNDVNPDNPRHWDNLTQMVCFHGRYNVGDKTSYRSSDYNGWDELEKDLIKNEDPAIIEPLYMYDHSGASISTTPFNCSWDSGQIGFVFIKKDSVRKQLGVNRVTKKIVDRLSKCLLGEVETYNQYISGEVFEYTIFDKNGDIEDHCGGFFGYDIQSNGILDNLSREDSDLLIKQL